MSRNTPLRNRVKELRERLNVRQSELAREAGVTRQTIIAIEKGRLNPSILISLKIAKLLREPVDYIFYLQPGFDYEQEARENANRPKRGRKKRAPAAPVGEPSVAAAPPVAEPARVAPSVEKTQPSPEPALPKEPSRIEPAPAPAKKSASAPTVDKDAQKGDDAKTGQAIWDFF
ncbi:MAG: helix-turn-helix domain-containing protein [Candidatus Hydrogenedentes bacterium]|nr:helix-turn-helix domain-containing protein [Candidatus Hydrogenedentota bacterium]